MPDCTAKIPGERSHAKIARLEAEIERLKGLDSVAAVLRLETELATSEAKRKGTVSAIPAIVAHSRCPYCEATCTHAGRA